MITLHHQLTYSWSSRSVIGLGHEVQPTKSLKFPKQTLIQALLNLSAARVLSSPTTLAPIHSSVLTNVVNLVRPRGTPHYSPRRARTEPVYQLGGSGYLLAEFVPPELAANLQLHIE